MSAVGITVDTYIGARSERDDAGRVWLAHSGTLGGRQTGISRLGFLRVLGGALAAGLR